MNFTSSTVTPAFARTRLAPVFAALGLLAAGAAIAAPVYKCQRLDSDNLNGTGGEASAINDRNVVVGWAYDGVVKWNKKADHLLGRCPSETGAVPAGINNDGIVAGTVQVGGFPIHRSAARWNADGSCHVLDQLTADHAYARGINNRGEIAGQLVYVNDDVAGVWSATGEWKALPTPSGTEFPSALAINDSGTVVGFARHADGPGMVAIRWKDGRAKRLPFLPNVSDNSTWASGINEQGQIVGHSGWHAATWFNGEVHALPGDGLEGSNAVSVNRAGQIVGFLSWTQPVYWPAYTAAPIAVADLLAGGGCTGPHGETATVTALAAINDRGVIAATGEWKDASGSTVQSVFRLQPVQAE
jgi:uncharacterized membrane protein